MASGYHDATIRTLAASADLSGPGYHHHCASKQTVLVEIMNRAMAELYDRTAAAIADAGDDPLARLDAYVECLVLFHAHRGQLAFIAASEIRALDGASRNAHIAARDRQQKLLEQIVRDGLDAGVLSVASPRDTVRALITMCTGISQLFRIGGETAPEQLVAEYVGYGRALLGAPR